jgi:hypothetical protein
MRAALNAPSPAVRPGLANVCRKEYMSNSRTPQQVGERAFVWTDFGQQRLDLLLGECPTSHASAPVCSANCHSTFSPNGCTSRVLSKIDRAALGTGAPLQLETSASTLSPGHIEHQGMQLLAGLRRHDH